MYEFLIGVGIALVLEGLLYALAPSGAKRMAAQIIDIPEATLRNFGLIALAGGVGLIWAVKAF